MSDADLEDFGTTRVAEKLLCAVILDGSSSMSERDAINELNDGLRALVEELRTDPRASRSVRLLLIRVGDLEDGDAGAEILLRWTDVADLGGNLPYVRADGLTPLGAGARLALQEIEQEKIRLRGQGSPLLRPWLFIISDGLPNDEGWEHAAEDCRNAEAARKVSVLPFGTEHADLDALALFSEVNRPVVVREARFRELFVWLSGTLKTITRIGSTQLPGLPRGTWSR
jgi:uncharacterized protein YegL